MEKIEETLIDIDKRFHWQEVKGKTILFADASHTTNEEQIALIYRLPYYSKHFPEGIKKAYLLINCEGTTPKSSLKHMIKYAKNHNYFERTICYGGFNPFVITAVKMSSKFLKNKARIFKTKKEAIDYVLK